MTQINLSSTEVAALQAILQFYLTQPEAYLSVVEEEQARNLLALVQGQSEPYPGI